MDTWRRFRSKYVIDESGCWLWTAAKFSNGYGLFGLSGKPRRNALAHRWLYERMVGPVPDGLDLDHLCRVRHCVNPDHLEPVTRSENLRRGLKRQPQSHCKRGHPLSGDNLYVMANGHRACRTCRADVSRRAKERLRTDLERLDAYRAQDARRGREARTRARGGSEANPNSEKTHCPQGHPYAGDNLVMSGKARRCRICIREANRRAYLKRTSK